jgi:cation/acetate symporter
MSPVAVVSLAAILALMAVLAFALRPRQTTTLDYFLAGQRVGVVANACAICGDYFSAASFLGVAAAVYASGLDGIWYATGFAAGWVPVLLFVGAPLRRFGEFSIPDFLGRRLRSEQVRVMGVVVVQMVIISYLVPQAVASGITWQVLVGFGIAGAAPYETGVVLSSVAIAGVVMLGGMRGTTWTQAIQFLFLLSALLWLTAVVVGSGVTYTRAVERAAEEPLRNPVLIDGEWRLQAEPNALDPTRPARFDRPGARYSAFGGFALIVTLVLGTAGLPHVMNRYFTCPTGRAARLTTVWVLGLAGGFYALAVFLGAAARGIIPSAGDFLANDLTVEGVLAIPEYALLALGEIYGGRLGLGLIATGALVAVMSTIAGLLLAAAASWGHDVYERHINPSATQRQTVRAGQLTVAVTAAVSALLALWLQPDDLSGLFPSLIATMVTWAFAVAGSAVTPVFLLSIWWPRTTAAGVAAGMAVGASTAVALVLLGLGTAQAGSPVASVLLTPTVVAAPLAALSCVLVSWFTSPPENLDALWLRLHGTAADRQAERLSGLMLSDGHARARTRQRGEQ